MDDRDFVSHGVRNLADSIRHKREAEAYAAESGPIKLPTDFTTEIPAVGLQWLLKGGVNGYLVKHYGIGWSDKLGRVVIPVHRNGTLVAVQSRAVFPDQKPKYLNITGFNSLFRSDRDVMFSVPTDTWGVLTEDILSTIRVGRLQPSWASLGTSLNHRGAARILQEHDRMMIWYDSDEAGVRGARKASRAFELQGAEVRIVKTTLDPKAYSNADIVRILEDYK